MVETFPLISSNPKDALEQLYNAGSMYVHEGKASKRSKERNYIIHFLEFDNSRIGPPGWHSIPVKVPSSGPSIQDRQMLSSTPRGLALCQH